MPHSAETHHLIGDVQFRLMKPSAIFISTGRGKVVDEPALIAALQEGRIAGAGLDVFEREPELADGLAELDNVVLLPHLGSATRGSRAGMSCLPAYTVVKERGSCKNGEHLRTFPLA